MRSRVIFVAFSLTIGACSSGSSSSTGAAAAPAGTKPTVRHQANLITEEELAQSPARNALQAIQMLRPDWLRGRGAASIRETTPAQAVVYVNDQRLGGPDQLEGITTSSIKSLRFISSSEATNRWGTGHGGGAIAVTTR